MKYKIKEQKIILKHIGRIFISLTQTINCLICASQQTTKMDSVAVDYNRKNI